jgi:uncharacterized protein (TIGR03083 family)
MSDELTVLEASVARLRELVAPLTPEQLRAPAYPTEWTVADVLSHLGSGAVISTLWVDQALGGTEVTPQPIWDEWNAKDPDAQAADLLVADRQLVDRLNSLSDEERDRFAFVMGPMDLDLAGFLRLRLNEHAVHTWDVAVGFDPEATLAPDAVPLVLDAVSMLAGFSGRPSESPQEFRIRTVGPDRRFTVSSTPDGVTLAPDDGAGDATADIALPTEAFVRLVYGRLDPAHTPPVEGAEETLDALRHTFPGF